MLNNERKFQILILRIPWSCHAGVVINKREREMFYLTTHSTHFIYGYMASDIWLRTILIVRKETCWRHIGYSYRLTARVLLYEPSHNLGLNVHNTTGLISRMPNSGWNYGMLNNERKFQILVLRIPWSCQPGVVMNKEWNESTAHYAWGQSITKQHVIRLH